MHKIVFILIVFVFDFSYAQSDVFIELIKIEKTEYDIIIHNNSKKDIMLFLPEKIDCINVPIYTFGLMSESLNEGGNCIVYKSKCNSVRNINRDDFVLIKKGNKKNIH
ncbi:hypothetical protein [Tenacibaculum jejuense]|uniref:Uncharacterized protein n=1 Tax=Tenacibaculum jejuense TaxID=584609 RepID=A0A238U729_9FLAO|nr:hypothetical protein [Tenacibaculum jejuense]SNR14180.1 protein of unknown function [Tenacibaculum jejuense]